MIVLLPPQSEEMKEGGKCCIHFSGPAFFFPNGSRSSWTFDSVAAAKELGFKSFCHFERAATTGSSGITREEDDLPALKDFLNLFDGYTIGAEGVCHFGKESVPYLDAGQEPTDLSWFGRGVEQFKARYPEHLHILLLPAKEADLMLPSDTIIVIVIVQRFEMLRTLSALAEIVGCRSLEKAKSLRQNYDNARIAASIDRVFDHS